MRRKLFILLPLAMPSILEAKAQDTEKDSIEQRTLLENVEVFAIRAGEQTPFAFSNLHEQEIAKLNDGKSLPYILGDMPSVLLNSDDGVGVGYADLRIRGTDNQRINFTLNGIPVNDAESQGTFFVNFPDLMSSSSSVQVQRGVGSSTYGAGVFGASVNISNNTLSENAEADIVNTVGSYGLRRHTIQAATGKLDNNFAFNARLSRISSDGYTERSGSDLRALQFLAGWESDDRNTSLKFNLMTGSERTGQAWNGVPEDSLATNRRYNELGIKDDGTYYEDQTDNYQQDFYQLFASHRFSDVWSVNAALFLTRGRGYYNEYRQGEEYADYGLPNVEVGGVEVAETSLIRQLWLDNYFYGTVWSARYKTLKNTIDIGASITRYQGDHYGRVKWAQQGIPADYQWYDNPAKKNDQNAFVKWEHWLSSRLISFVDLQVRNVQYELDGFRKTPDVYHNESWLFFNPKAGLTYIDRAHRAFVSVARAAKEPNRDDFEANAEAIAQPEKLLDFEAGYRYKKSNWGAGLVLYYMHYQDQLVATGKINDVGAYTRQNVDQSFRRGVELEFWAQPHQSLRFNAHATFAQNKIKEFTEYIDDYDEGGQLEIQHQNTDIALSPASMGQVMMTYMPTELPRLEVSLVGQHVGRQYLDNTSNEARSIDPYTLLHLRAAYSFQASWLRSGSVRLNVNNLLNTKYESKGYTYSYIYSGLNTHNYYYPQAGTNISLTLSLGF